MHNDGRVCLPSPELLLVLSSIVVDQHVGGVALDIAQDITGTAGNEQLLHLVRGVGARVEGRLRGGGQRQVVGNQTGNVRGSHRCSRNGALGSLGANPGRLDVLSRSEDINTLSDVGEVGARVIQGRGTDSDGFSNAGGGVVAGIAVVVTGGDGKVKTSSNSSCNVVVQGTGLATSEGHVGDGTLVLLALLLGESLVLLDGIVDTSNDVGHGAGSVGAQDLDGDNVGLLGDTIGSAGNGSGAVSTVAVVICIRVVGGDGLTPLGSALELVVFSVDTGVDDKDSDALSSVGVVLVLVEGAEGQCFAVGDTGETPGGAGLDLDVGSINKLVALNVVDLKDASICVRKKKSALARTQDDDADWIRWVRLVSRGM